MTSTKKKSAYFTGPDFSAARIEKKNVRKLREQIRYFEDEDSKLFRNVGTPVTKHLPSYRRKR
jgi:hypothetical protein